MRGKLRIGLASLAALLAIAVGLVAADVISGALGGPDYQWYPKPWIQGPSKYASENPNGTDLCKDANGVVGGCPDCPSSTPTGALACDIDGQPRREVYQSAPNCPLNTIPDAGADEYYQVGCEPYGYGVVPVSASGLTLVLLAQTTTTITLGWTPVSGADGYRFTREGFVKPSGVQRYSHTWTGSTSQVTFSKGSAWYRVEALDVTDSAEYP